MKLIYLANFRIPTEKAHGLQIMKMCEAFAEAGLEVELIVSRRRNPIKIEAFEYYGVKQNFTIKHLPSLDLVNSLPKIGTWLSRMSFLVSAKVYLLFTKYDVLYLRERMTAAAFKDFVLEMHALPDKQRSQDLSAWAKASKIVVLTQKLKEELVELGVSPEKILVAADAVDLRIFSKSSSKQEVRRRLNLPADEKIIMYTGHVYEWKGTGVLLAAASIAQESTLPWKFVFVGGTDFDLPKFKKQAEGLKNTLILGQKPYSDIPFYLQAADVLALPNSGKFEISRSYTSPLKLFEYMASGRPIVASDLSSVREILDEKTAVLVPPDDSRAIFSALEKLFSDDRLGDRLALAARGLVQNYTWQKRVQKILDFIKIQT